MLKNNITSFITNATPSLLAIMIVETVNVEVYLNGPVSQSSFMLFAWLFLQLFPGFIFGYISDKRCRKKVFLICQILGLVSGAILSIYGFEIWVLTFIGLTFNPQPVARAALLDNFPHYSTLKIVAVTFLAQYIPWSFFGYLSKVPYKPVVVIILVLMAINIF